jgi:DNA-binding transcriptional LysR family regulator
MRLNVSQPSVSKAISDMEHVIGVRLLDRTPKGVEATAYGRALLRRGMGAFDELRQGIKDIEQLSDPTSGEVRIGCPEAIASGLMMAAIMRFSAQHPRVLISVTAANNLSQEYRLLRDRSVDFLVGAPAQPFMQDDLSAEILYQDQSYILCGTEHRLARRRKVALADLVHEQWLLPRESVFSSHLTQAFDSKGLAAPKLGVRSYSVHQRVGLLMTNRFISAESGSTLRYNATRFPIRVLPVNFNSLKWPVAIVTLKKRTVSPVVQTFIGCVRETAKPLAKANAPLS